MVEKRDYEQSIPVIGYKSGSAPASHGRSASAAPRVNYSQGMGSQGVGYTPVNQRKKEDPWAAVSNVWSSVTANVGKAVDASSEAVSSKEFQEVGTKVTDLGTKAWTGMSGFFSSVLETGSTLLEEPAPPKFELYPSEHRVAPSSNFMDHVASVPESQQPVATSPTEKWGWSNDEEEDLKREPVPASVPSTSKPIPVASSSAVATETKEDDDDPWGMLNDF